MRPQLGVRDAGREALLDRAGERGLDAVRVAIGIRPEKIRVGGESPNTLAGTVAESAYIGVSTQYIVETQAGSVTVYVQNVRPGAEGAAPGDRLTLSWSPDATFVVDSTEGSA